MATVPIARRDLLKLSALTALAGGGTGALGGCARAPHAPAGRADNTVRIGTGLVELADDTIVGRVMRSV